MAADASPAAPAQPAEQLIASGGGDKRQRQQQQEEQGTDSAAAGASPGTVLGGCPDHGRESGSMGGAGADAKAQRPAVASADVSAEEAAAVEVSGEQGSVQQQVSGVAQAQGQAQAHAQAQARQQAGAREHQHQQLPPPPQAGAPPSQNQAIDACTGDAFLAKAGDELAAVVEECARCDPSGTFLEPVDASLAPGYDKVIETPMDFTTLRGKVAAKEYACWRAFVHDIDLISKNAMKYNQKRSKIHRAATNLQRKTRKIVSAAQNRLFPPPPRSKKKALPPAPLLPPRPAAPAAPKSAAEAAADAAAKHADAAEKAAAAREAARVAQAKMLEAARAGAEAAAAIVRGAAGKDAADGDDDSSEASEAMSLAASEFSATDSEDDGALAVGGGARARARAPAGRALSRARGGGKPPAPGVAVSSEWREYRSSIEWRCRWLELRMRELHAQRRHYQRLELQLGERRREWQAASTGFEAEGRVAKREEGAESSMKVDCADAAAKAEPMDVDEPQQRPRQQEADKAAEGANAPSVSAQDAATDGQAGAAAAAGTDADTSSLTARGMRTPRMRKARVHFDALGGGVDGALASHPLMGSKDSLATAGLAACGGGGAAKAREGGAEDNDASVVALHEHIARLQEKVDTLAHQLKMRRPGEAPPLGELPPRKLPRVPLAPPPSLAPAPAAAPAAARAGGAGAGGGAGGGGALAGAGAADGGAPDALTPDGASLKRKDSTTSSSDKKRRKASTFDIGNMVMPGPSMAKAVAPTRHEDIQTPRVRLLDELLAEENGDALRSRPGWCDVEVGVSFGNDCSEPLDDTSFLMRHAAMEATERVRYAASRGQHGAAAEEQQAYATAAAALASPALQPAADYKLVAQAQSSGAAGHGGEQQQPRRNVLVIRRQPSNAGDAAAANADGPAAGAGQPLAAAE